MRKRTAQPRSRHTPMGLILFAIATIALVGCSSVRNDEETRPKECIEEAAHPAPQWEDYLLYCTIGLPRDIVDLPFSSVVFVEQQCGGGGVAAFVLAGVPIGMTVDRVIWGYGYTRILPSVWAAWGSYVGWLLVGHPVETLVCRAPYDTEWWVLQERKSKSPLFFPNYHGMLK